MRKLVLSGSLAAFLSLSAVVLADPATFGAKMPDGDAVAVTKALADPAQYAGKPQKFSGEITEVCQRKGCWVILAEGDVMARVRMHDHAFSVPAETRGAAVVYGTLSEVEVGEAMAKHLAEDAGDAEADKAKAGREFEIDALSIELVAH